MPTPWAKRGQSAQLKMGKLTWASKGRGFVWRFQSRAWTQPGSCELTWAPQPLACWEKHAVLEGRGTTHRASLILKVRGTGPAGGRGAEQTVLALEARKTGQRDQGSSAWSCAKPPVPGKKRGDARPGGHARVTGRVGPPGD